MNQMDCQKSVLTVYGSSSSNTSEEHQYIKHHINTWPRTVIKRYLLEKYVQSPQSNKISVSVDIYRLKTANAMHINFYIQYTNSNKKCDPISWYQTYKIVLIYLYLFWSLSLQHTYQKEIDLIYIFAQSYRKVIFTQSTF